MPICTRVHFSRFDPKVPHFSRKDPGVRTRQLRGGWGTRKGDGVKGSVTASEGVMPKLIIDARDHRPKGLKSLDHGTVHMCSFTR